MLVSPQGHFQSSQPLWAPIQHSSEISLNLMQGNFKSKCSTKNRERSIGVTTTTAFQLIFLLQIASILGQEIAHFGQKKTFLFNTNSEMYRKFFKNFESWRQKILCFVDKYSSQWDPWELPAIKMCNFQLVATLFDSL